MDFFKNNFIYRWKGELYVSNYLNNRIHYDDFNRYDFKSSFQ